MASNDATPLGVKGPSAVEGAWIKGFDLRNGENRVSVRLPVSPAIANDFALGPDGSLYVSNTLGIQIFRLGPAATELEVYVENELLKGGLDGFAFGDDGALYANTFMGGELFRIASGGQNAPTVQKLRTSSKLSFPDGLRAFRGGLLMVQGGGTLDRMTVSNDEARIETIGKFAGPSGVTVSRDKVWVSEGQLAYLFDPAKKEQPRPNFHLRAVPIPEK